MPCTPETLLYQGTFFTKYIVFKYVVSKSHGIIIFTCLVQPGRLSQAELSFHHSYLSVVGLRLPHLRGPHTFLSSLSFLLIWEISTMYWSLRVCRYIKTHKNLAKHVDKSNRKLNWRSSIWNLALVWMCTLLVHVLGVVVWETFPGEMQYKTKTTATTKTTWWISHALHVDNILSPS